MVPPRVLLFDWTTGGHHRAYVRRFAEALVPDVDVVIAVPDDELDAHGDLDVDRVALGDSRPREDRSRPLRPQFRAFAAREMALFRDAIGASGATHAVHLYADPILRRVVHDERPFPVPVTVCVFGASFLYPRCYGIRLSPRERLESGFREYLVHRWRGRPDAAAVLVLDEGVARVWARRSGGKPRGFRGSGRVAPAIWLPEPPVPEPPVRAPHGTERQGIVLYGALDAHKGIDLLAGALASRPTDHHVTLAGPVAPGYRGEFDALVERMRGAGASVHTLDRSLTEPEGLALLRAARCAVLPYHRQLQMSRVLVEAAASGTPVVANDNGLVGWLTAHHALGVAVDCRDASRLRDALDTVVREGPLPRRAALERFACRYAAPVFRAQIRRAVGVDAGGGEAGVIPTRARAATR